jgi:enamine deaminase RidA (YjgF/YER057c/UK114 family)
MRTCTTALGLFALLLETGLAFSQPPKEAGLRSIEPNRSTGSSLAVVVDPTALAHTAQLLPLDAKGELVGKGDAPRQIEQVLDNLALVLKEVRSGLDQVVKVNVYVAQTEVVDKIHQAFAKRFTGQVQPAVSFVVGQLADPEALVALDAVAVVANAADRKTVQRVHGATLPGKRELAHVAVLPTGGAVYVAGQAEKGTLAEATRATIKSLHATLAHFGLSRAEVVQLKAFLQPMSDVRIVETEIAKLYEGETVPPLVFVEWKSSLPIEIELIAAANPAASGTATEAVSYLTPPGMTASPVFSRVARIQHGKRIYISGLYGNKSQDGEAQIREIFASLKQILQQAGGDMRHLVKATYYVSDDVADRKLNEIRPEFYDPKRPPSASKARVPGVGMAGKSVTLDMIAVTPR